MVDILYYNDKVSVSREKFAFRLHTQTQRKERNYFLANNCYII